MMSFNAPGSLAPEFKKRLIQLKIAYVNIGLLLALALPAAAQVSDESATEITETEIAEEEAIEADTDGSLDDTMNSIDVREGLDGIGLSADVRVGYFEGEIDERDGLQTQPRHRSELRASRRRLVVVTAVQAK
jgi:hypothetical protein